MAIQGGGGGGGGENKTKGGRELRGTYMSDVFSRYIVIRVSLMSQLFRVLS